MRIPQRAGAAAPAGSASGGAARLVPPHAHAPRTSNTRADVNARAERTKPRWRGAGAGAAAPVVLSARRLSVGRSGGRLPERIRTRQRGRGSALRAFSPTIMVFE